ncbi:phosphatase PAP2 family protein [Beggiatoa leptomitoformis]|uniref:Phosphatase PAP2 family protein n=1 Tax=Beggiatoa leptomitoformis TaxID=288004 RepID=A0A2N9YJ29_9GAMM|nr:phosphatase PAP2 family protein [Beggiatoa leptomitoformis]ALG69302.2 phosphatase PAP2 family protein [Beggiatoa leptomitoformis]AUI70510.2 phosphatase PAP2 family protein [Beggiatoa leptomitoformis]
MSIEINVPVAEQENILEKMLNRQILLTLLVLVGSLLFFELSGLDIWVQDYFYNVELSQWLVDKDAALAKFIFYDGIKKLFVLFVVGLLLTLLFFRKNKYVQAYQQGLLIVFFAVICVPLVIGVLKATTNIPCPKNIVHYQGNYPYITLFKAYPSDFHQTEKIKCFPAGHASGGFALLSLFFLFRSQRNRRIALVVAMGIAWNIGIYKMLIGDHFLSHTVTTMIVAWLLILLIAKGVYAYFERGQPVN